MRQELAAEAHAGFPLLRRTPCTLTVALLDYYAELDEADREALLAGLAEVAAGRMVYRASGNPAVAAFHAAMQSPRYAGGYRYTGVKLIRLMKGDPKSWAKFQQTAGRPASAELIPDMERMVPAKAQQLRKLCKPLLAGPVMEMQVAIDFGSMLGQLRYGATSEVFRGLAWESLWGAYMGWDLVTEENAERSVWVLLEHLERLSRIRRKIAGSV